MARRKVRLPNSRLNDTKEGASAAAAGSLFHTGMFLGKKLNLKQSVDVGYCWNFKECAALVFLLNAGWCQVSGVWYGYQVVNDFVEDSKL